MMEYKGLPENLKDLMNNYKIHVLELQNIQDLYKFKTDLREVFGFIQCSGDMKAEKAFTLENEDRFKALDEDAFDVIVSVTGADELEKVKETYREDGGKINMCEAIRGMIAEGRMEGRMEGQKEKAYNTAKNMFTRGFTAEETAGLIEESLETVAEWFKIWKEE